MRRKRLLTKNDTEATFELDLAPMLALMVTLIPIMLLATSFVKVRVIGTVLPQAVQEAIQQDKQKLSKTITIDLQMNKDDFKIIVKEDEKEVLAKVVPPTDGKWDFEALHSALYDVKKQFPEKYTVNLYPAQAVPYSEVVNAMDAAREAKKSEDTFQVFDKETQKNINTRVMFPEVSFSGLIGG